MYRLSKMPDFELDAIINAKDELTYINPPHLYALQTIEGNGTPSLFTSVMLLFPL